MSVHAVLLGPVINLPDPHLYTPHHHDSSRLIASVTTSSYWSSSHSWNLQCNCTDHN